MTKHKKEDDVSNTRRWPNNPRHQRLYAQERLTVQITEQINDWLEERNMTHADLARRLQKKRSHISQLLDGEREMTLKALADICWALEIQIEIVEKR